ncbi:MAG: hypothetical protein IJR70_09210 [Eubacterium sp.]|nr:hypothetical protein [Eubacterium sp.]
MKEFLAKIKEWFKNSPSICKVGFEKFKPKFKAFSKKFCTKKNLTIAGIIVLIPVLVISSIKVIDFARTAYLRPYIEKYKIEFPEGILEEMCDAYGKDQTVRGKIEVEDLNYKTYVSEILKDNKAFLENDADITKDQHFRAIRFNKKDVDLESLYSTDKLFLKSSQSIKFTTLYQEEQYRVIAAFYINTNPEDDGGYVYPYNFCGNMSEKDFESFEDRLTHRTLYDTGYEYNYEDYFLSISVPSDFMEDFRFVIVCVKTDKKGFEKVKKATPNEKIFFPQVWYDVNNEENPYRFAGKWIPKGI